MEYALMIHVSKKALTSAHSCCFSSRKFLLFLCFLAVFWCQTEFAASSAVSFAVALFMDSFNFCVMLITGYVQALSIVICAQDCITLGTFDEVEPRGMSAGIKGPFDFFKTQHTGAFCLTRPSNITRPSNSRWRRERGGGKRIKSNSIINISI